MNEVFIFIIIINWSLDFISKLLLLVVMVKSFSYVNHECTSLTMLQLKDMETINI